MTQEFLAVLAEGISVGIDAPFDFFQQLVFPAGRQELGLEGLDVSRGIRRTRHYGRYWHGHGHCHRHGHCH
jgi:hypothetical protein